MINLQIDASGDLTVEDGSLVRITGDDAIIQNLRATLYHWRNEWFLDTGSGIDYKNRVLTRRYNPVNAQREIKRAIKNAEGIRSIDRFEMTRSGNTITLNFTVTTINATTIPIAEELTI